MVLRRIFMKSQNKSVYISIAFITLFALAMLFLTVTIPWLVPFLCRIMERETLVSFMTVVAYMSLPAGWGAVWLLYELLFNVKKKHIFIDENVKFLRILSKLCFYVGCVSAVAMFQYLGFLFVSIAAFFIGLMVRVVRNIIQEAIEIKEENDMTV